MNQTLNAPDKKIYTQRISALSQHLKEHCEQNKCVLIIENTLLNQVIENDLLMLCDGFLTYPKEGIRSEIHILIKYKDKFDRTGKVQFLKKIPQALH